MDLKWHLVFEKQYRDRLKLEKSYTEKGLEPPNILDDFLRQTQTPRVAGPELTYNSYRGYLKKRGFVAAAGRIVRVSMVE